MRFGLESMLLFALTVNTKKAWLDSVTFHQPKCDRMRFSRLQLAGTAGDRQAAH